MSNPPVPKRVLLGRGSWSEDSRIGDLLRQETVGGALLLVGTTVALVWANSPASDSYEALRDYRIGPAALHLHLSLGTWAADGLLAIFFFVVGLELKREFVAGDLREPRRAALPILAAVGGMVVPASIFVAVNATTGDSAPARAAPRAISASRRFMFLPFIAHPRRSRRYGCARPVRDPRRRSCRRRSFRFLRTSRSLR